MSIKKGWAERFFKIEYDDRKYFGKKHKKKSKRQLKLELFPDKQAIIDYIKLHDIKTCYQLTLHHKKNKDTAPSTYFIRKYWGDWKHFLIENPIAEFHEVNVKKTKKDKPLFPISDRGVVAWIADYSLFKLEQYKEFRKNNTRYNLPSIREIYKMFGSWENVRKLAMAFSMKSLLDRYVELFNKLERHPTNQECYVNNVEIDRILEKWSREELKEFISHIDKFR